MSCCFAVWWWEILFIGFKASQPCYELIRRFWCMGATGLFTEMSYLKGDAGIWWCFSGIFWLVRWCSKIRLSPVVFHQVVFARRYTFITLNFVTSFINVLLLLTYCQLTAYLFTRVKQLFILFLDHCTTTKLAGDVLNFSYCLIAWILHFPPLLSKNTFCCTANYTHKAGAVDLCSF